MEVHQKRSIRSDYPKDNTVHYTVHYTADVFRFTAIAYTINEVLCMKSKCESYLICLVAHIQELSGIATANCSNARRVHGRELFSSTES